MNVNTNPAECEKMANAMLSGKIIKCIKIETKPLAVVIELSSGASFKFDFVGSGSYEVLPTDPPAKAIARALLENPDFMEILTASVPLLFCPEDFEIPRTKNKICKNGCLACWNTAIVQGAVRMPNKETLYDLIKERIESN